MQYFGIALVSTIVTMCSCSLFALVREDNVCYYLLSSACFFLLSCLTGKFFEERIKV